MDPGTGVVGGRRDALRRRVRATLLESLYGGGGVGGRVWRCRRRGRLAAGRMVRRAWSDKLGVCCASGRIGVDGRPARVNFVGRLGHGTWPLRPPVAVGGARGRTACRDNPGFVAGRRRRRGARRTGRIGSGGGRERGGPRRMGRGAGRRAVGPLRVCFKRMRHLCGVVDRSGARAPAPHGIGQETGRIRA